MKMESRIGIIGITISNFNSVSTVNEILHEFSKIIVGRMGLPYREKNISIISIIVDGTNDEISAMTGRIGNIKDVNVKSMLTKNP